MGKTRKENNPEVEAIPFDWQCCGRFLGQAEPADHGKGPIPSLMGWTTFRISLADVRLGQGRSRGYYTAHDDSSGVVKSETRRRARR